MDDKKLDDKPLPSDPNLKVTSERKSLVERLRGWMNRYMISDEGRELIEEAVKILEKDEKGLTTVQSIPLQDCPDETAELRKQLVQCQKDNLKGASAFKQLDDMYKNLCITFCQTVLERDELKAALIRAEAELRPSIFRRDL